MIINDKKYEDKDVIIEDDDNESFEPSDIENKNFHKIRFTLKRRIKCLSDINDIFKGKSSNMTFVDDFDAQRGYVWNDEKKYKLIDSLFYGLPINVIWLISTIQSPYECFIVDGKQRMNAIREFLEGKLKFNSKFMTSFTGTEIGKKLNNKTYGELPPILKAQIDNYDIDLCCIILEEENRENSSAKMIFEIFNRLNSGTPLSAQEIRNSLYPSNFNKLLKIYINSDKINESLIPKNYFARLKTCEMFYRFLGGLVSWNNSTKKYENFKSVSDRITTFMEKMKNNNDESIDNYYLSLLDDVIKKAVCVFGYAAFRKYERIFLNKEDKFIWKYKKTINVPLFEMQLFFFCVLKFEFVKKNKEKIKKAYESMFMEVEGNNEKNNNVQNFLYNLRAATGDPKKMKDRIDAFFEALETKPNFDDYENYVRNE